MNGADELVRCVWGVDLGSSAAQSAVAAFWPTSRVRWLWWRRFPSCRALEKRGHRDGVAGLYRQCHREGSLITDWEAPYRGRDRVWCGSRWNGSVRPAVVAS